MNHSGVFDTPMSTSSGSQRWLSSSRSSLSWPTSRGINLVERSRYFPHRSAQFALTPPFTSSSARLCAPSPRQTPEMLWNVSRTDATRTYALRVKVGARLLSVVHNCLYLWYRLKLRTWLALSSLSDTACALQSSFSAS